MVMAPDAMSRGAKVVMRGAMKPVVAAAAAAKVGVMAGAVAVAAAVAVSARLKGHANVSMPRASHSRRKLVQMWRRQQ